MSNFNNRIVLIVVLATIFGLLSGVVGTTITRVYLLEDAFNLPMIGDINLSGGFDNNSGLVIRNAKKIVIEQNDKVNETINNVKSGIVGIFKKLEDAKLETKKTVDVKNDLTFDLKNYYTLSEEEGQGFVITSDGWIMSNFIPDSYKNDLTTTTKETILKDYVIISGDKKIYNVVNIIIDPLNKYAFWQISASDLSVKSFADSDGLKNGQLIVATNWDGDALLTSVVAKIENKNELIKSSDELLTEIKISEAIGEEFFAGFIFNLNSEIVGIIDASGRAELISNIVPCMNCLFKTGKIAYPKFGVNYIEMSALLDGEKGAYTKGALIYPNKTGISIVKGGPAGLAGLKEGDIITKINNTEINSENSLSSEINNFLPGDELLVEYSRDGKIATVKVLLK